CTCWWCSCCRCWPAAGGCRGSASGRWNGSGAGSPTASGRRCGWRRGEGHRGRALSDNGGSCRHRIAPVTPQQDHSQTDVLVVGAGVSGLATALALLEDGRGVTVVDAGKVGAGASHGNCGTLTPSHAPPPAGPGTLGRAARWMFTPDAPPYIRPTLDPQVLRWMLGFALRCNARDYAASARAKYALLSDSRRRIQQWVGRYGLECEFAETGEDYVFRSQAGMDRELRDVPLLRELGLDVEIVDGAAYEAQDPAFRPGLVGAIRFRGDAALRPDRYVAELARAGRERGGRTVEDCALQALAPAGDGMRAETAHGPIRARDVVLATGAWAPRIAAA